MELIEDEELRQKVFDYFDQTQTNFKRTFKNESTMSMSFSELGRSSEQRQSKESNFLVQRKKVKQPGTSMRLDSVDDILLYKELAISPMQKGKSQVLETSIKRREEVFAISDPDSAK